jgi:hypothetical protein
MENPTISRRSFLQNSSLAGAGVSAFTIIKPELVRGAGKEMIRAGLVGCGGRGTQASVNLLSGDPNVELVAVGDLMPDRMEDCLAQLQSPKYVLSNVGRVSKITKQNVDELAKSVMSRVKVDPEHRFTGFDAYKRVLASDIDLVLLCAPPVYRPIHLEAAVEARHNHLVNEVGIDDKKLETDNQPDPRFKATPEELKAKGIEDYQLWYAIQTLNRGVPAGKKK